MNTTILKNDQKEIFYYNEEKSAYSPLVSEEGIPVIIIDDPEGVGASSDRDRQFIPNNGLELFYYSDGEQKYKSLFQNGGIPVRIVGGAIGDGGNVGDLSNYITKQTFNTNKAEVDEKLEKKATIIAKDTVPPELQIGEYWLDTSDKTYQGTVFENLDSKTKALETEVGSLSEQLAQTAKQQVDFVKLLQEHNEVASTLYAKVAGDRKIEVLLPFKGKKVAHYVLTKDNLDDYIKLGLGAVSETTLTDNVVLRKNYESKTGTWITNSEPNYYATQVGATFSLTFEGTGFDFQHYVDNKGGVWEFTVDGEIVKTISTHVDAVPSDELIGVSRTNGIRPIVRGLNHGTHTILATFKGDDPDNPPASGAGTSRGWARFSLTNPSELFYTVIIYDTFFGSAKKFDIMQQTSNKEYALSIRPSELATGNYNWLPDHGIGTVFADEQKVYFDDNLITDWVIDTHWKEVKVVKVVQKMKGYHTNSDPNKTNPVAEIYSVHTVSAKGVSVKVKIKWLRKVTIGSGYGAMFPVVSPFVNRLITSYNNNYDATITDGSATYLSENDKAISYAFINETGGNGEKDIVVAMTIQNIEQTFRYGELGKFAPNMVWLEHRDTNMQKLYPQVFYKHGVEIGDTYEVGCTYFIGELPMASDLLIP